MTVDWEKEVKKVSRAKLEEWNDPHAVKINPVRAAHARAESARCDEQFRTDLLMAELNGRSTINTDHIKALAGLNDKQIAATKNLNDAQLRIAKASAWAAGFAAAAAIGTLLFNLFINAQ